MPKQEQSGPEIMLNSRCESLQKPEKYEACLKLKKKIPSCPRLPKFPLPAPRSNLHGEETPIHLGEIFTYALSSRKSRL